MILLHEQYFVKNSLETDYNHSEPPSFPLYWFEKATGIKTDARRMAATIMKLNVKEQLIPAKSLFFFFFLFTSETLDSVLVCAEA